MRALAAAILVVAAWGMGAQPACGQVPQGAPTAEPDDGVRIFLLTVGVGDGVDELFGHNAIWVHDPANARDDTYHWGVFNPGEPGFMARFIRGEMQYGTEVVPLSVFLASYRAADREVLAQELDLTPTQIAELVERMRINQLPENRLYRYDYYLDNCSTRVRDHLDAVLGGQIGRATQGVLTGGTYRSVTALHTWETPLVYAGIQLGLGNRGEQELSQWDEMFLPGRLARYLRGIEVTGAGAGRPLVVSEAIAVTSTRAPPPTETHGRYRAFLAIGMAIGILMIGLGRAGARGSTGATRTALALGATWSAVAGLAASVLLWMVLFTEHTFTYRNENLFQFEPVSLVLGLALVLAFRSGLPSRRVVAAAWVVAAISAAGFVLQILPGLDQMNGELIALALPAHLGVALALSRMSRPTP